MGMPMRTSALMMMFKARATCRTPSTAPRICSAIGTIPRMSVRTSSIASRFRTITAPSRPSTTPVRSASRLSDVRAMAAAMP